MAGSVALLADSLDMLGDAPVHGVRHELPEIDNLLLLRLPTVEAIGGVGALALVAKGAGAWS